MAVPASFPMPWNVKLTAPVQKRFTQNFYNKWLFRKMSHHFQGREQIRKQNHA